jgi:hypothetical protein
MRMLRKGGQQGPTPKGFAEIKQRFEDLGLAGGGYGFWSYAVAGVSGITVAELQALSDNERMQLLSLVNRGQAGFGRAADMNELFTRATGQDVELWDKTHEQPDLT